ncbi:MAG: hypothetical protein ACREQ7_00220 [Candidatus Binatia bacterium]
MNIELVEKIVRAVLYEGYMLYPYRASALKNRQRWNFGVLFPENSSLVQTGAERSTMQTECLVAAGPQTMISARARFLHLAASEAPENAGLFSNSCPETIEREVSTPELDLTRLSEHRIDFPFEFHPHETTQGLRGPDGKNVIVRRGNQEPLQGTVELQATPIGNQTSKLTVRIRNLTPGEPEASAVRDRALVRSLISTHVILKVEFGEFVSLIDPPDELREAAAACRNIGAWPVLVGAEGERDCMLSSPITLYDYPQIAPESAGDLYDGTEIDELLTLRILTLTDEEKQQMREGGAHVRQILERSESLPAEQLMKLHGAVRGLREAKRGSKR